MIYTNSRRRKMNKALVSLYPDITFSEASNSIPVMECDILPEGAVQIDCIETLKNHVSTCCSRTGHLGLTLLDHSKTLPVFILSQKPDGTGLRPFYRVNYVSPTEDSILRAAEYIAQGLLYVAPGDKGK